MSLPALLPWQAGQAERFRAARQAGRIGHALLLNGAEGVGTRGFAHWMAAALLCAAPDAGGVACGACRSCVLFAAGSHPDWTVLQPEEDKRDIAIDAVRELGERLALSAQLGGARVALVDPADALSSGGINALLKTIEEPPMGAYLLLLSARPQALPATLRSRCQRLNFPVPAPARALEWLAGERPQAEPAQRALALHLAFGAPLAAAGLIDAGALERDGTWRSLLAEISAGRLDPLQAAGRIGKDEQRGFVRWLLSEAAARLREQLASPVAGSLPAAGLQRFCQVCLETLRNLERNANALLAIESLLIGWRALSSRKLDPA